MSDSCIIIYISIVLTTAVVFASLLSKTFITTTVLILSLAVTALLGYGMNERGSSIGEIVLKVGPLLVAWGVSVYYLAVSKILYVDSWRSVAMRVKATFLLVLIILAAYIFLISYTNITAPAALVTLLEKVLKKDLFFFITYALLAIVAILSSLMDCHGCAGMGFFAIAAISIIILLVEGEGLSIDFLGHVFLNFVMGLHMCFKVDD